MHEEASLQEMSDSLEYIPIRSNPRRRISVSPLPKQAPQSSRAEQAVNILSGLISAGCSAAMVYLVARVAGMI